MPEITITENGVEKVLQNLNPNKACGLDELTPRLLKELAHELTPIVTMIFQRSLELGKKVISGISLKTSFGMSGISLSVSVVKTD
jgi:hypothetical protein